MLVKVSVFTVVLLSVVFFVSVNIVQHVGRIVVPSVSTKTLRTTRANLPKDINHKNMLKNYARYTVNFRKKTKPWEWV